ncbi:bifunctional transcriptional activator/DNA repair enzyme AdaA [Companilactobacillus mishanensis]|uniref:bifunctional transcriptional activator/DNA repair enzyme AdaA n=1 Tax=Companilactobacillus mishanensis TaxID=2486008 RepID=UPI0012951C65|nr:bifunctional transcriptional activator/DNA repair enzyme AdaA [Companilactobacillus mishanensis]MQS89792.1 methylphosphotriester-DNA--protein-cysteine methyltransferase family protein [Companilactobacillus mishanensis]
MVTQSEWLAIKNNDTNYDGKFWYAVSSTKIFCRPSCPSRLPKRENISIYSNPDQALADGFRPCKRCRPLNAIVSNEIWVKEIDNFLEENYSNNITLEYLANEIHGSESYLRHVYKDLTGMTPKQRLTIIRLDAAKSMLLNSEKPVKSIGEQVGISNPAYFIKLFKNQFGVTPKQFQSKKHDINI